MKRLLYLAYYLYKMDWLLLRRFAQQTRVTQQCSIPKQGWAVIRDSLRYNISPLEWYQFGFVKLDSAEKQTWAGTGTMYEAQRRLNPIGVRAVLDDKRQFYQAYRKFFRHAVYDRADLAADTTVLEQLLRDNNRLVLKAANGKCIDLALTAARHQPQNRSIGWDIAVTPHGPGLIEGNHDWCKLVWQLPVGRGLKEKIPVA